MTHTTLPQSIPIGMSVVFSSSFETLEVELVEIVPQKSNEEWSSFHLKLITDNLTYRKLETATFFHNKPENRLDVVEGGFNPSLKVHWEIALDDKSFDLLPDPDSIESYFKNLSRISPLWQEERWKAHFIWTEIPVDDSLGGGVIKVGYKTIFSKPADPIEVMKRQGVISEAVVTALIEGSLPVHFDNVTQHFKLGVQLEENIYEVSIEPDNANFGLILRIVHPLEISALSKEKAIEFTKNINQEVDLGEFSISSEQFSYFHHLKVSPALVSCQWVSETLLAGLSLMHEKLSQLLRSPRS